LSPSPSSAGVRPAPETFSETDLGAAEGHQPINARLKYFSVVGQFIIPKKNEYSKKSLTTIDEI